MVANPSYALIKARYASITVSAMPTPQCLLVHANQAEILAIHVPFRSEIFDDFAYLNCARSWPQISRIKGNRSEEIICTQQAGGSEEEVGVCVARCLSDEGRQPRIPDPEDACREQGDEIRRSLKRISAFRAACARTAVEQDTRDDVMHAVCLGCCKHKTSMPRQDRQSSEDDIACSQRRCKNGGLCISLIQRSASLCAVNLSSE